MDGEGRDLHDVADVEQVHPLALVQVPQQHLHVYVRSQFLLAPAAPKFFYFALHPFRWFAL